MFFFLFIYLFIN